MNNFCEIISHCNVAIRAGWLNYLLVGPELHRYHHSAALSESRNYGTTLPLFANLLQKLVSDAGELPWRRARARTKRSAHG